MDQTKKSYSRVLLQKITVPQQVTKYSRTSFGNLSLTTVVTTARYLFLSTATSTTSTPCYRSTKALDNIPKHF